MPETYTGDEGADALAAGYDIMDGTEDRRDGWLAINKTRDIIARLFSAIWPVTAGGTGATTAAGARTNLGAASSDDLTSGLAARPIKNGLSWPKAIAQVETSPSHQLGMWYSEGESRPVVRIDATDIVLASKGDADNKLPKAGGTMTGDLYLSSASAVTSSYVAMYRNGDGRVGISPSAARFKKDIKDHAYTLDNLLRIRVVSYRLRASVYGSGDAPTDVGVIAEELIDAGLEEFVVYDENGDPLSVHYERLALVAIGALQDLAGDLDVLAARVTALEGNNE